MMFKQKLCDRLKHKIPAKKLQYVPASYHIIGKVLLVKLKPEVCRYRRCIGDEILDMLPYIISVLEVRDITGKKRLPRTEVIAGSKCTETLHKEWGCKFLLDPRKVMFSKGNKFEKQQLVSKIKKGDIVVDMFAGIGYWSIPIARAQRALEIYSIELNPVAFSYLESNAHLNNVKIKALKGDCRKYARALQNSANKVIMGYFGTEQFFKHGLQIAKNGATIFYHDLVADSELKQKKERLNAIAEKQQCKLRFLSARKVKSYAAGIGHYVFDIKIRR